MAPRRVAATCPYKEREGSRAVGMNFSLEVPLNRYKTLDDFS